MGSDDRDSAVYAPFDAIKSHYGYLHRIKDIGEALQLAPKVNSSTGRYAIDIRYCWNVHVRRKMYTSCRRPRIFSQVEDPFGETP